MPVSEYERLLHTDFARTLRKPFRRAVEEYRMFAPGDHVAACISGGKDSMLLALLLRGLARELPLEISFLAMDPGYAPAHRQHIEANAERLGLPLHFFGTNILRVAGRHSPEHPCFLFAKMRRGQLQSLAPLLGAAPLHN